MKQGIFLFNSLRLSVNVKQLTKAAGVESLSFDEIYEPRKPLFAFDSNQSVHPIVAFWLERPIEGLNGSLCIKTNNSKYYNSDWYVDSDLQAISSPL